MLKSRMRRLPIDRQGERMTRWVRRLTSFFHRRRLDDDLADEMRMHVELRRQALVDDGMDPREADDGRRAGCLATSPRSTERARDERGMPSLASFLQDLRFGVRLMTRNLAPQRGDRADDRLRRRRSTARSSWLFNATFLRATRRGQASEVVSLDDGRPRLGLRTRTTSTTAIAPARRSTSPRSAAIA